MSANNWGSGRNINHKNSNGGGLKLSIGAPKRIALQSVCKFEHCKSSRRGDESLHYKIKQFDSSKEFVSSPNLGASSSEDKNKSINDNRRTISFSSARVSHGFDGPSEAIGLFYVMVLSAQLMKWLSPNSFTAQS